MSLTSTDLHEMGWNDVAGNLRRATQSSAAQKRAFLRGEELPFKGPQHIIDDLNAKMED